MALGWMPARSDAVRQRARDTIFRLRSLAFGGLVVLLACANGCQVVFGLPEVPLPPPCVYSHDVMDEDCDGIANAIDPCPADAAGVGDLDTDHDGIGDACDPTPAVDKMLLFDGFGAMSPAWTPDSGDWQFGDGALRNDAYDGAIHALVNLNRPGAELVVDELDRDPAVANPIVTLDAQINIFVGTAELDCAVVVPATGPATLVFGTMSMPLAGSGRLWIAMNQLVDGTARCRAHFEDSATVEIVSGNPGNVANVLAIGMKTSGVRTHFDSITVYGQ